MDPWVFALVAVLGFVLAVALSLGKPIAYPAAVVAFGAEVFTSEAAIAGAGITGSLTVPKLLPLAVLAATSVWSFILPKRIEGPILTTPLKWLIAYVACLSLAALASNNPGSGVLRIVQIGLPIVAVVAARRSGQRLTHYVAAAVIACAAHVYYAVFLDPNYVGLVGLQRLTGLLIANSFGLAAGVAIAAAFGYWLSHRGSLVVTVVLWGTIGVCAYALVQSQARTAAIAILVTLFAATVTASASGIPRSRGRAAIAMVGMLLVAFYVAFQPTLLYTVTSRFIKGNNDLTTLTGRTPLWSKLLGAVMDHPILGFGPNAFRDQDPRLIRYLTVPEAQLSVAHNSLIEALVAGGVLAGLLWLAMMVSAARHVWRVPPLLRPMTVALFVVTAISAITGSSQAGIGIGWYLIVALSALSQVPSSTEADTEGWQGSKSSPQPPVTATTRIRSLREHE